MVDFITIKEAATLLELHYSTVRRYVATGFLKGYKLGSKTNKKAWNKRSWRINIEDFNSFAKQEIITNFKEKS